jgi:flagellar export protein FliJ
MNHRASRLEPMAELADKFETQAARRLAASAKALQRKENEVEQLRSYLAEYRQRAELEQSSTDALRWQNRRAFLAQLSEAVARKETELQAAEEDYRLEAERWRESYRRAKGLDSVVERAEREAAEEARRRVQAELDELAMRRTLGGPPS